MLNSMTAQPDFSTMTGLFILATIMTLDFLRHLKEIRYHEVFIDQDLQQDQAILYDTLILSHIDSQVLCLFGIQ